MVKTGQNRGKTRSYCKHENRDNFDSVGDVKNKSEIFWNFQEMIPYCCRRD